MGRVRGHLGMRARSGGEGFGRAPVLDGRRSYPGDVEKSNEATGCLDSCGFPLIRSRCVDAFHTVCLSFQARLQTWSSMDRAPSHEADIQAAQPETGQQARIPRTHEDEGRTQGAQPAPSSRPRQTRREGRREVGGASRPRGEALPREARITRSAEIEALLERGKRRRTRNLDVFFASSPASRSRFGAIVPKHGHRIVDRNLVKRRLREIGRRDVLPTLDAAEAWTDVLVRARRSAYAAGYEDLKRELAEALETTWSQSS